MITLSKHKIISLVFAVGFSVLIYIFTSPVPVFRYLLPTFVIYLISLVIYNWRYLLKQDDLSWWLLIRIPVFLIIWFGVLFIIPSGFFQVMFLLASIIVIFFFETLVANKGQQLAWNLFLLSSASLFLGLYGLNFYFPLHGLIYLGLVFLGTVVLVRISLETIPHDSRVKWLSGLVLGLFASELFWALQFLPLHFSVLAILALLILYLLWSIYYHYLYRTLTLKQVQLNAVLVLILILVILFSSPWTIQS